MKMLKKSLLAMCMLPSVAFAGQADKYVVTPSDGLTGTQLLQKLEVLGDSLGINAERVMFDGTSVVLSVKDGVLSNAVYGVLSKLDVISTVEKDIVVMPTSVPNDDLYSRQWALFEDAGGIRSQEAHNKSTGLGVVIGVVDTGGVPHPDLDANRLAGYDFVSNVSNARDGDGRDANANDEGDFTTIGQCGASSSSSWHGSHVAGIANGVTDNGVGIASAAPNAKHQHIRALASCGGSLSDIADGVAWASGATVPGTMVNPNPSSVINLSLGGNGTCSSYMQRAINVANENGAVVVVAAGNSSVDASGTVPANCNNVITVASTGRDGARATYSNYGAVVDIAAPGGGNGGGILSTIDSGSREQAGPTYAEYQGTSMATPYVAGVVALLQSAKPDITPTEVEDVLKESARDFPGACVGCGTGIVDADSALTAIGAKEGDRPVQEDPTDPVDEEPVEDQPVEEVEQEVAYGGSTNIRMGDASSFLFFTFTSTTSTSLQVDQNGTQSFVEVEIKHNRLSDLSVSVELPDGQQKALTLVDRKSGKGTYVLNVGDGEFGNYRLSVTDSRAGQSGTITGFKVTQIEKR